ncbi:MAG: phage holin family protein [Bacteroidetes bacterium]|jgi:flagellar biosynthesis/type III secretory pathway M-ring protein FliF/YscJ|nr:MAG: phage holin family protein [Bacteroidota bacterium]TAE70054.1 MAG: phage holin family protein [Bacteroidota bacterium]TAF98470.1 MAG: phage holin family protein [Bacteroidota bacterium]
METNQYFTQLKSQLSDYVEGRLQLLKLQSTDKIAVLVAGFSMGAVAAFCLFFVLLFASLAVGFQLSGYFQSSFLGFGAVAIFYLLLVLIILVFFRKTIQTVIVNKVIETLLEDEADEQPIKSNNHPN